MGGLTNEAYLSLRSAENIMMNLDRQKYDFVCLEWKTDKTLAVFHDNSYQKIKKVCESISEYLSEKEIDIVFNALHGDEEGDGRLNGMFEMLNIPYTGNGYYSCATGMNKYLSKCIFQQNDVPTPNHIIVSGGPKSETPGRELFDSVKYPCIVKPVKSGSSLGIKKACDLNELVSATDELLDKQCESVLIEEYIEGRELTIGAFGRYYEKVDILPIARMEFEGDFFDEDTKYKNEYDPIIPARISHTLEKEISELAEKIHTAMMFEGLSRTDVIVKDDRVFVLEINTHPGLGPHSIIPKMLREAKIPMREVIDNLIKWGFERHGNGKWH